MRSIPCPKKELNFCRCQEGQTVLSYKNWEDSHKKEGERIGGEKKGQSAIGCEARKETHWCTFRSSKKGGGERYVGFET